MKTVDAGIRVKHNTGWENCLIMVDSFKIDIFIPPKEASYWSIDKLNMNTKDSVTIANNNTCSAFEDSDDAEYIILPKELNVNSVPNGEYKNTFPVHRYSFELRNCTVKRKTSEKYYNSYCISYRITLKNRHQKIKFGFSDRNLFEKYFDEFSKNIIPAKSMFSLFKYSNSSNVSSLLLKSNPNKNGSFIIQPEKKKKKRKTCGGKFSCF